MKFLQNIIEKVKPQFEKGGKMEKFAPAFDALETFMFVPGHVTRKGSHIRDGIDLKRTMITVVIALVPCLLFGMWNTGHQHMLAIGENTGLGDALLDKFIYGLMLVVPIIVVSYGTGLGVEFIFAIVKKHQVNEGFLVSGMLIPLVMPVDVPLWMVGIATIFAVLIGKEVFGGTGMNVLNPALTARAFLFFAYPTKMSGNDVWVSVPRGADGAPEGVVDAYTGATPLGDMASTVDLTKQFRSAKAEGAVEKASALQDQMDGIIAGLPDWSDAFFGWIPGSIGETSVIACLLGAAILIYTGIGSWKIMVSMLAGGWAMGLIFNAFAVNPFMEIPAHEMLMFGGFFFGMVFMATDPVSAAQTDVGKIIYGFLCGFLGIMIRVFNPAFPEGIMMAILFMNVMAPLIDHYVVEANIKRRNKRLKNAVVAKPELQSA